jgi:hypothetical protein
MGKFFTVEFLFHIFISMEKKTIELIETLVECIEN